MFSGENKKSEGVNKMKVKMKQTLGIVLSVALVFSSAACSFQKEDPKEQKKFDEFLEEQFIDSVEEDSLSLHFYVKNPEDFGIKEPEADVGSYSYDELKKSVEECKEVQKELKTFKYKALSKEQQITYDTLVAFLETQTKYEGYEYYQNPFSYSSGIPTNLVTNFTEFRIESEEDIKLYLALLDDVDDLMEDLIAFAKEQSKEGLFMPDFAVDATVEQMKKSVIDAKENALVLVFNSKVDKVEGLSEEQKEEYKKAGEQKMNEVVIPAYKKLADELEGLKGTGKNEEGICKFEKGKEFYEILAKDKTSSNMSVKEMIEMTEDAMEESLKEMQTLIVSNQDLISVYMDNFESVSLPVNQPKEMLDYLNEHSEEYFPEVSDTNYSVEALHKSLETDNVLAYFLEPPVDDNSDNIIKYNETASKKGKVNFYQTIAHEGYPGHLYQSIYTDDKKTPYIRKLINFLGCSEGWAMYAESYATLLAGMDEDVAELINLNTKLNYAISARVDLGVNYEGWDLKKLEEYMTNLGLDSSMAKELFESVVEEPASILPYSLGYLQIEELKEEAQDQLGKKFDEKEFNKVLLDTGNTRFDIVEKQVEAYIKETK